MPGKKTALRVVIVLLGVFLSVEAIGYYIASRQGSENKDSPGSRTKNRHLNEFRTKNNALKEGLESLSPKGVYIVIDTVENVLYLKNGALTIRKAVISAGSGSILKEPDGKRRWVFDTPRGEFKVRSKIVNPKWIKPDWAFIEEGEDIPKRFKDRVEEGVLGDYALGFGNGYFIHGTLYTRLLGRNITHGCIRMADEDLRAVFNASSIGTRILIF